VPACFALLIAVVVLSGCMSSARCTQGCASLAHDFRAAGFDYYVQGDPALPRAAHTSFQLALMGGGGLVDSAYEAIARHAGNGHIVVLRVVAEDSDDHDSGDYGRLFVTRWGPVASAQTLVFHRRAAAYDPRVLAILRNADGIFLAGGDQGNYIRYWKGTPVQDALNAHLRAHRPIGGSSAGLAILGHYSYTSLDGGSMESKLALRDPFNAGVTLEDDFLHARYLEHVITDTHFSRRARLGRLIVFLARLNQSHPAGGIFGVGVDERSALLVDAQGIGRLAAGSQGSAWCVLPQQPARVLQKGQPLSIAAVRIVRLDQGSSIDLATRGIRAPGAQTLDAIEAGAPTQDSIATPLLTRDIVPPDES